MTQQQPYFSLFSSIREHMGSISDEALRVFMVLATYIDPFGMCYPGAAKIAELTGYTARKVQGALDELESAGWLYYRRRGERDPMTGHWLPNIYVLNPQLVSVRMPGSQFVPQPENPPILNTREELESADSQSLPQTGIPPILNAREDLLQIHHQIQNQLTNVSKPESVNHHHQSNLALKTEGQEPDLQLPMLYIAPRTGRDDSSKTKTTAANAASFENEPRRGADSLAPYAVPLPDGEAETLVDLVCARCSNMTTPNARRLVALYAAKDVRAGLVVLAAQPDIANPAGFLRFLLEKYAVDADRDVGMKPKENDDRRISRDPRDFIIG